MSRKQETSGGLLLKPLVEELSYKDGGDYFGINFPLGIDTKELALKLKEINRKP